MSNQKWILLAEDNLNDADLAIRALGVGRNGELVVVAHDGVEAMDCLHHRGEFQSRAGPGNPAVVLLDLKMPRMRGLEVLRQMKNDARLRDIPVIMFTSSREKADVARSYSLGANAYVVKPARFEELVAVMDHIKAFWLQINEPAPEEGAKAWKSAPSCRGRRASHKIAL
jgi:CheY-like chemotaxis protein